MSCDQEDPRGEPESTTLLTLLPVLLSQPGAGFFDLSFSIYPREVLVFVMRTPVGTTSALR
ncbi:hypothetical protein FA041_23560 [Escherichia coli]|nr:hypothetical protein [Escherichia coli]